MAIANAVVSVGTSPTRLDVDPTDQFLGASCAVYVPTGGVTVYVGSASINSSTGWPVDPGEKFFAALDPNETLYAVVASGTQNVRVMRGSI